MRARRRTRPVATLNDVARRAGVSPTTASYILNGHSTQMRISVRTQRRVLEAAAALSYRPNRSARDLRTATTKTIGVVSDFVASASAADLMLSGASAAARSSGHLVLVGDTEGDCALELLVIEEMLGRRVDGVLYVRRDTCEVVVPPVLRDVEVVLLNCLDESGTHSCVLPDERGAGRTAAQTLVDAGVADRVYLVGADPRPGALAAQLRLAGVRSLLAEHGRELAGVIECDLTAPAAYAAVHRWLREVPRRPSALVCLDDPVAMGVYQALAMHGLDVPRDVAVVSFDGSELAAWLRPALASVAVPYAEMGALAVARLVERGPASVSRAPMPLRRGESVPVTRVT